MLSTINNPTTTRKTKKTIPNTMLEEEEHYDNPCQDPLVLVICLRPMEPPFLVDPKRPWVQRDENDLSIEFEPEVAIVGAIFPKNEEDDEIDPFLNRDDVEVAPMAVHPMNEPPNEDDNDENL